MILATLESLKQRVNAPNLGSIDSKCGKLLEAATMYVAAYLSTDYAHATGVVDKFTLRQHDYRARTNMLRCELSNSHVSAITCKVANSKYNLRTGNYADVDAAEFEVDESKGIVALPEWVACDQVLEFTYTKGFETVDDGNGFQLAQNVPKWLEEAALVTAAYHYILPSLESTEELCQGLPCEARQLLDPHRRTRQDAYQAE